MKKTFKKILIIAFSIIVLSSALFYGYFFKKNEKSAYQIVEAKKGNIVQVVSATGKIKPADDIELAFKKTGRVTDVGVKVGDIIRAGQILVQIDNRDALKAANDAEAELDHAKLTLNKLEAQKAQLLRGSDLNRYYEEGMKVLDSFYGDVVYILDKLEELFFSNDFSGSEKNIAYYYDYFIYPTKSGKETIAKSLLDEAKNIHQEAFFTFQESKRGGEKRKEAIQKGYELALKIAGLVKFGKDPLQNLSDYLKINSLVHSSQEIIDEHLDKMTEINTTVNNYVDNLLSVVNNINKYEDELENRTMEIEIQKLIVKQKEETFKNNQRELQEYYLKSPIDGKVTKLDIKVGEIATANTPIVTVMSLSPLKIEANVPEVDIVKVKLEDIARVTLDAYGDEKEFTAKVVEVDPAENIIEGVPTYKTTLHFVNGNERVSPGMTANIEIITEKRENVITVPYRAVIVRDGEKFLNVIEGSSTKEVQVKTGLKGSDGNIEIIEGVLEGDKIVISFE